ncbi:ERF family protein [Zymobacter sp. IVIA_12111.31 C1]|uniref:ERF family protein n=1 Tax=Zymobacter sp. IVIA_12111.31 C1 TaxID=3394854 RepID=UPI0039C3A773
MTNEVQQVEQQGMQQMPANQAQSIMPIIEKMASMPELPIDKLERMLDMQERIMNRAAQEQFNSAMAEMQAEIPAIAERGQAHNMKYATFEDINDTVKPIMKRHGFGLTFRIKNLQGAVEITGVLMHTAGHREETSVMLPLDTTGSKNAVQAVGSSVSYGKRYVMCAMLNIATRGEDDNGASAARKPTVTAMQAGQIGRILAQCSEHTNEWFDSNWGDPANVHKDAFDRLMANLNAAREKAKASACADKAVQEADHADS